MPVAVLQHLRFRLRLLLLLQITLPSFYLYLFWSWLIQLRIDRRLIQIDFLRGHQPGGHEAVGCCRRVVALLRVHRLLLRPHRLRIRLQRTTRIIVRRHLPKQVVAALRVLSHPLAPI